MSQPPAHVVVGATSSIGRRVVAAAQRHNVQVTPLVRGLQRGERMLPGVDLVRGDLEQLASRTAAVRRIDAVVLTHGRDGRSDTARRIAGR